MANRSRAVGLIGLGIMGSAISKNLLAAGFEVFGFDISAERIRHLESMGGHAVAAVSALPSHADVLLTSLPSSAALFAVVEDLTRVSAEGLILAETSTFKLRDKATAFERLAAAKITMLDCPLSGSGVQALSRDVLVYGSGDRAAFDLCLPVFEGFSRAPHYLGLFGNGSRMKFIANHLVAIHTAAAGEAFALARMAGLEPSDVLRLVGDGAGSSTAMKARGAMLVADSYAPVQTMPLSLWLKDIDIIGSFAADYACPTPLFTKSAELFRLAIESGLGAEDTAAVAKVFERCADL